MTTITIELDDELARQIEESAKREQQSLSEWVAQRVRPEAYRAGHLESLESLARSNGYPAGWLSLFGSLADETEFSMPTRDAARQVTPLNGE